MAKFYISISLFFQFTLAGALVLHTNLQSQIGENNAQTFHIFQATHPDLHPNPELAHYPQFYKDTVTNFIDDVPKEVFENVHSAEMFILSAALSGGFGGRAGTFSADREDVPVNKLTHNGIGFLLRDQDGQELRRISFSYWAVASHKVDFASLTANGTLTFFNRAVSAYTLSKGEWEGGYWNASPLSPITVDDFKKGVTLAKEFGIKHPYIAGSEIWMDDKIIRPAVTCNTFVQEMVWAIKKIDVYKEKLVSIAFFVVELDSKTNVQFNSMHDVQIFPKALPFWPLWYNGNGVLTEVGNMPKTTYIGDPKRFYIRSNIADIVEMKSNC